MECPSCGSELEHEDTFGRYLGSRYEEVHGQIYRCPKGREQSEECDSSTFHVAGSYYTYEKGDGGQLHEGYPC